MYKDLLIPNIGAQAVRDALKRAFGENEVAFKTNREQLVDYYLSQQNDKDEYQKDYFNRNTDPNKQADYPHNLILAQCNITAKLIDKKAKSYIQQPVRKIDGEQDEYYDELLNDGMIKPVTKLFDRLTWLLGDHCVVVIADKDKEKIHFENPPYYIPFFSGTDLVNPVAVMYPMGIMGGEDDADDLYYQWSYWDAEKHTIFENQTWNVVKEEKNEHGCFNALFLHRMLPFRGHWTRDAQDVVDANRDINIQLTSINNAIRYHGFPILAALGLDPKDAAGIKIGFDKMIAIAPGLPGAEKVDLKSIAPTVNWDQMMGIIKTRIGMLTTTWNTDVRFELSGDPASGIALKIMSMDNTDDLNEVKELYEAFFEQPLFEMIKTFSTHILWMTEITGDKLTCDWAEEEFIETPTEKNARIEGRIRLNLTNPIKELMNENPDLATEDAAREYIKNRNVNTISIKQGISVDDILNALNPTDEEVSLLAGTNTEVRIGSNQPGGNEIPQGKDQEGILPGNQP
jgi:hypothetical protein